MSDDYFLRNRATIAIITGGTQGLGLAIAKRLAREGARGIILSGRSVDKGEGAAASVGSLGNGVPFCEGRCLGSRGLLSPRRRGPGAFRERQRPGELRGRNRPRHASGHLP